MEIEMRGVNPMMDEALHYLYAVGVEEPSRNGPVISLREPAILTYAHPAECVLFSPERDANPFFHVAEFLWMISGRNDLAWPLYFNSKFRQYSDDGQTLYAAYGYRWRQWFKRDQLSAIVHELQERPESRRAVLTMHDGFRDSEMWAVGKDLCCNTHAYFDLRGGVLNMTVCNRSNDAIFGALGANVVHFSLLLCYMSAWLGVPVGRYTQFSANFHAYTSIASRKRLKELAVDAGIHDYYKLGEVKPFPLVNTDIEAWDADLKRFFENPMRPLGTYDDTFFNNVAGPMFWAWNARKLKLDSGLSWAKQITAPDWRRACVEWIERRENRRNA